MACPGCRLAVAVQLCGPVSPHSTLYTLCWMLLAGDVTDSQHKLYWTTAGHHWWTRPTPSHSWGENVGEQSGAVQQCDALKCSNFVCYNPSLSVAGTEVIHVL